MGSLAPLAFIFEPKLSTGRDAVDPDDFGRIAKLRNDFHSAKLLFFPAQMMLDMRNSV